MAIVISIAVFIIVTILQTAGVISQQVVTSLVPAPNSPISTSANVSGSLQCTKNADESYAVCASQSNTAIKYNLQPFSFAAKGPDQGNYMRSCDLYEADSQSTSRAVCVKSGNPSGIVYFHCVSDMINVTNVTIGVVGISAHVVVDTLNQVAFISNGGIPPVVYKIENIGSSTPIIVATLSSFGSDFKYPAAMLIIDGFLYVHFDMDPARLARIDIASFTWAQTVAFASGESGGFYDNLANDDNFIYDLTQSGILVRCTYKNNNFARFDSLNTGLTHTISLAISPDQRTLFVVSNGNGVLQMVDVSSFAMFGNPVSVPNAFGRPIVTSRYIYAFRASSDLVYPFQYPNRATPSLLAQFTEMLDFKILSFTVTTIFLLFYGSVRNNNANQFRLQLEKERKRADLAGTQLASLTIQVRQKDRQIQQNGRLIGEKDDQNQQQDQQLKRQSSEITELKQQLFTLQSQLNNIANQTTAKKNGNDDDDESAQFAATGAVYGINPYVVVAGHDEKTVTDVMHLSISENGFGNNNEAPTVGTLAAAFAEKKRQIAFFDGELSEAESKKKFIESLDKDILRSLLICKNVAEPIIKAIFEGNYNGFDFVDDDFVETVFDDEIKKRFSISRMNMSSFIKIREALLREKS